MTPPSIRAPREDEAGAVAALFNDIARARDGSSDTTEDEVRIWFTAPNVDRARDIRVAVAAGGELLAYGDVSAHAGKAWLDIREHRAAGDGSAAKAILDTLASRARELVSEPVVLRAWIPGEEALLEGLFEREGFELVRHSFRMRIDLGQQPPAPEWAEGITVRHFEPGRDEQTVYHVQNEGFADMWEYEPEPYDEWLHFMTGVEDFDPTVWFLVEDGREVVGACLCRSSEPGDPDLGWVRVLCVRPAWRRRGIALALLRHAFGEFRRRGRAAAGLGVDAGSTTGALELYERAGMYVFKRSDIYEKPLAP